MEMMISRRSLQTILCGCALGLTAVCSTGCQVSIGGQTLPSPFYIDDDVQYFAPGPEFKLANEAAAMKLYNEDQQAQGQ